MVVNAFTGRACPGAAKRADNLEGLPPLGDRSIAKIGFALQTQGSGGPS